MCGRLSPRGHLIQTNGQDRDGVFTTIRILSVENIIDLIPPVGHIKTRVPAGDVIGCWLLGFAMTGIVQVAANASFAMALKQDGSAVAWGKNDLGQLGNGSFTDSASPVPVTGLGSASQLAAGRSQAFAILKDSTLRAWGNNGNEQLGISTAKPHFPAMQLVPDAADANANSVPDAERNWGRVNYLKSLAVCPWRFWTGRVWGAMNCVRCAA